MTASFPLQKTPPSVLKLVMQNLEIIDILSLSLTSTKTSMALVPVNHPIHALYVRISRGILDLEIYSRHRDLKATCTPERIGTSELSFTSLRTGPQLWNFTKTNLRSWLLDVLRILNYSGIDCFFFSNGTDNLGKDAVELLNGIKIKCLNSANLLVARMLQKNTDSLRWGLGRHPKQEFLIQNMTSFSDQRAFDTKITINDLLVSNIRFIYLNQMYFPLREYNRFLKCWIRGGTSNLEFLKVQRAMNFEQWYGITMDENNFEERLFKGIPHIKIETSGRFEIRKKNGQRAMIEFKPRSFTMIVPRN